MDIIISRLPKYVNQFLATTFDENPSLFRCGTASGAMCLDFAYPDKHNVYQVEHDSYVKLVGPDNPQDKNGVDRTDMQKFFADFRVGVIDMNPLVDQCYQNGDYAPLHAEIEAQNRQGVIQMMSVADESLLINDDNGQSLHPGLHFGHCIVRLGFSDDAGYGLYFDPANPLACTDPVKHTYKPVKISWESMLKARPNFCYAIMPPAVVPPPADFSFIHGVWPVPPAPKPVLDITKVLNNLQAIGSVGVQLTNLAADLAKDVAALKEEV